MQGYTCLTVFKLGVVLQTQSSKVRAIETLLVLPLYLLDFLSPHNLFPLIFSHLSRYFPEPKIFKLLLESLSIDTIYYCNMLSSF